jgi:uncharacterized protein (DUF697 family)
MNIQIITGVQMNVVLLQTRFMMTNSQKKRCHTIIHGAAVSGAGIAAAMAQLPGSDNVPLVALEVGMTITLGSVFGISITESAAKSIIVGAWGTTNGRGIFQFGIGWIPGLGNSLNAGTAASVIELLEWAIVKDFCNEKNRK